MYQYNTQGVCSKAIYFEVEDNKVKNVSLGAFQINNDACRILCVGYSGYIVALGSFKAGDHLHKLVLYAAE